MLPDAIIRKQLDHTLLGTDFPGLGIKYQGKVRDNYTKNNKRIIIVSDRISAFDRVLGTIPFKGQVLNQMAVFWFNKTRHIAPNHLIDSPDPNVVVAKQCTTIPVEMVVRGYITGVTTTSAWYHYQKGVRNFAGNILPDGMKKNQKFDKPILTPSTKAAKGGHDESVSKQEILARGLVSKDAFGEMAEMALRLFAYGQEKALENGLILVDTKYEFGRDNRGNIILIDEIHTPDSSRYWYASEYEERFRAGEKQKKVDKEYVREWLAAQGFIGEGKQPPLTNEVKTEAARRYIQAYETITGNEFEVSEQEHILLRIERNLKRAGYL